MSDYMTQEDAMNMDNRRAIEILKPLRDMMLDQNGCPISDAYFAMDKAINALAADVRENIRGEWFNHYITQSENSLAFECSVCGMLSSGRHNFCPNCGAEMKTADSEQQSILAEGGQHEH